MALTKKSVVVPDDLRGVSDRALKEMKRKSTERIERVRSAPDPGKGESATEAQQARDALVAEARDAKSDYTRVDAEFAAWAAKEKMSRLSLSELFAGSPNVHERAEAAKTAKQQQDAERREFHAESGAARNERAAAERERKVKAGQVYEPVGGWDAGRRNGAERSSEGQIETGLTHGNRSHHRRAGPHRAAAALLTA